MKTERSFSFISSAPFWIEDKRRVETLRILANKALGKGRNRAAEIRKVLAAQVKAFNRDREPRNQLHLWSDVVFPRFLRTELVPENFPATFSLLAAELFRRTMAAGPTRDAYDALTSNGYPDIRSDFADYCDHHKIDMDRWDWRHLVDAQKVEIGARELEVKALFPFFDAFVRATQLTVTQCTVEHSAFPDDLCEPDQEFRRFLIYRNSISANRISKMYGFFRRSRPEYPYPTFAIWYRDDNGRRIETTSIMLGAQQAVHLFGPMGSGIGLNLISLSRRALAYRSFAGLQLSTDSNGIPIASRLLFVETAIERDDDAGIGIMSRTRLSSEGLDRHQLAMLSNRVGIERTDLLQDGEAMSHEAAKEFVANRLADAPVMMGELGIPYNPADTQHVPFNTALFLK